MASNNYVFWFTFEMSRINSSIISLLMVSWHCKIKILIIKIWNETESATLESHVHIVTDTLRFINSAIVGES